MKQGNKYSSYDDYIKHQASKTQNPNVMKGLAKKRNTRVEWFQEQFKRIQQETGVNFRTRILCLGARYGEEVEAFRNLGRPAIGIDIVPFLPYVLPGDMNDLSKYKDVQTIYTNAVDHCWSVPSFVVGITKALKYNGLLIIHHGFGLGEYETWSPNDIDEFKTFFDDYRIIMEYGIKPKQYNLSYCLVLQKGVS